MISIRNGRWLDCDRPYVGTGAYRLHSDHRYFGESGPFYRSCDFRRRRGSFAALAFYRGSAARRGFVNRFLMNDTSKSYVIEAAHFT